MMFCCVQRKKQTDKIRASRIYLSEYGGQIFKFKPWPIKMKRIFSIFTNEKTKRQKLSREAFWLKHENLNLIFFSRFSSTSFFETQFQTFTSKSTWSLYLISSSSSTLMANILFNFSWILNIFCFFGKILFREKNLVYSWFLLLWD